MEIDLKKIDPVLSRYSGKKGALIPVLQETQDIYGYLPQTAIDKIADKLSLTASDVFGVATFYTQFRLTPIGKYVIKVCHGTACHVGGAKVLDELFREKLGVGFGETTKDGLFTLLQVACLGCCSLAPVIMINDKTYGKLSTDKLNKIIDEYIQNEKKAG